MITRIREVRRARKLTLQQVAERCSPPTTPQTIGRLEMGARTVSVGWLNRIAKALGVEAGDLVRSPDKGDVPILALIGTQGAHAPRHASVSAPARPGDDMIAVQVESGVGDYRSGDEIWCERLDPENFGRAVRAEDGDDRKLGAVGMVDEVRRLDPQCGGDAVEPADRYGAGAGFQAADGLRGCRGRAGPRNLVEGHPARPAYLANSSDHRLSPPLQREPTWFSSVLQICRCGKATEQFREAIWRNRRGGDKAG